MKQKKVAIIQSNYITWKGYFDIINMVDLFIFLDDVQYTVKSWRNRNRIKNKDGTIWLTVPCGRDWHRLICEVEIKDHSWQARHWKIISNSYKKTAYFNEYKYFFEDFYLNHVWTNLSDMNQYITKKISSEILGFKTQFDDSRNYVQKEKGKAERVLEILRKVEATEYLAGPVSKPYNDPEKFKRDNIRLTWMDYSGYPEYRQPYPPFEHDVSIIDLIFSEGPNAKKFLKSTRC